MISVRSGTLLWLVRLARRPTAIAAARYSSVQPGVQTPPDVLQCLGTDRNLTGGNRAKLAVTSSAIQHVALSGKVLYRAKASLFSLQIPIFVRHLHHHHLLLPRRRLRRIRRVQHLHGASDGIQTCAAIGCGPTISLPAVHWTLCHRQSWVRSPRECIPAAGLRPFSTYGMSPIHT